MVNVTLDPETELRIQERIASGEYGSIAEVIHEALVALDEREWLDQMRATLQVGLDELDRGEGTPLTSEWRAEQMELAIQRVKAGERPNPDVCP